MNETLPVPSDQLIANPVNFHFSSFPTQLIQRSSFPYQLISNSIDFHFSSFPTQLVQLSSFPYQLISNSAYLSFQLISSPGYTTHLISNSAHFRLNLFSFQLTSNSAYTTQLISIPAHFQPSFLLSTGLWVRAPWASGLCARTKMARLSKLAKTNSQTTQNSAQTVPKQATQRGPKSIKKQSEINE